MPSIQQKPLLQSSRHPSCHSSVTCFHLHIIDVTRCLTLSMCLQFPQEPEEKNTQALKNC